MSPWSARKEPSRELVPIDDVIGNLPGWCRREAVRQRDRECYARKRDFKRPASARADASTSKRQPITGATR
jgi:hypothetical protein